MVSNIMKCVLLVLIFLSSLPATAEAISVAPLQRVIIDPPPAVVSTVTSVQSLPVVLPNELSNSAGATTVVILSTSSADMDASDFQSEKYLEKNERTISSPGEKNGINPQPEPPIDAPAGAVISTRLDPQLEPPLPISSDIVPETNKTLVKPLERQGLNPQPEPPAIPVDVLGEVQMDNNQVKLIQGEKQFMLRSSPENFTRDLSSVLQKKGFPTDAVQQINLQVIENKAMYKFKVKERVKLFGLMPMHINTEVVLSADNNAVQTIRRPWYARLVTLVNNVADIKLTSDFALTKLELVPNAYKIGDNVVATVTLSNQGLVGGQTEYGIFGSGTRWVVYTGTAQAAMYLAGPVYLGPGQSYTYNLSFKSINCDAVRVEFDPGNFLDEENFANNTIGVQGVCTP